MTLVLVRNLSYLLLLPHCKWPFNHVCTTGQLWFPSLPNDIPALKIAEHLSRWCQSSKTINSIWNAITVWTSMHHAALSSYRRASLGFNCKSHKIKQRTRNNQEMSAEDRMWSTSILPSHSLQLELKAPKLKKANQDLNWRRRPSDGQHSKLYSTLEWSSLRVMEGKATMWGR